MVSCVVINYNGEKFLKTCLDSLRSLHYGEKEIIFLDNASQDKSVAYVAAHYQNTRIIANTVNSGYAGAADQAIKETTGEYIMLLNPDIVFEPDYLNILIGRLESNSSIGAIIGKLRRFDFENKKKVEMIDSAGLKMYRNRRCVDRGQGEIDRGQYERAEEVFGITGACPLYRRSSLEDIQVGGEYFDTDFFMYKEDVDVSWRLRLMGWKCFYEPAAIAYHVRGTGIHDRSSIIGVAKNRKTLSPFQKRYSYINERLMRAKNELAAHVVRDIVPILWKEFLMFGWMTVREPYLWKSFAAFLKKLPSALKKRAEIMRRKKATQKEMQRWFS